MNGTARRPRISGQLYDASHRSYVEDKLLKNHFGPTYLKTLKDIATKSEVKKPT